MFLPFGLLFLTILKLAGVEREQQQQQGGGGGEKEEEEKYLLTLEINNNPLWNFVK